MQEAEGVSTEPAQSERPAGRYCVFCEIAGKREPGEIFYEDDEVIAFRNKLKWLPVMLLVIHKRHETQSDLWLHMGDVGRVAVELGKRFCPNGFRLLSNFGYDGMQSQEHGHVHVIGGTFLGPYA